MKSCNAERNDKRNAIIRQRKQSDDSANGKYDRKTAGADVGSIYDDGRGRNAFDDI